MGIAYGDYSSDKQIKMQNVTALTDFKCKKYKGAIFFLQCPETKTILIVKP